MKKKIVGILVCTLMVAAAVLPVAGTMNIVRNQDVETPNESGGLLNSDQGTPKPKPTPPTWIIGPLCWLPDCDWNYWTDPPNMYTIPTGNVGIGDSTPDATLEVNGSVALATDSYAAVWIGGDPISTTNADLRILSQGYFYSFAVGDRDGNNYFTVTSRGANVYDVLHLEPRTSAPPASTGDIYTDGTNIYCYLSGSWKQLN